MSDGHGGVTRYSGTSFAAPLVSGAIALMYERWPWLRAYPKDVAKAILESAQDLGAPGVDPVYGHGLLDIEASQSALDLNDLVYYLKDSRASEWQAGKQVSVFIEVIRAEEVSNVFAEIAAASMGDSR